MRCYAETFAARNLPEMRSPTTGKPFAVRTLTGTRWTGAVELIPSKLDEPLRWRKPQRIFVNSMSDLFHESLKDEAIDRVFVTMARAPRHTFQTLTKRPERMRAYAAGMASLSPKDRTRRLVASSYRGHPAERLVWAPVEDAYVGDLEWPPGNWWAGTSVEDQATADERIPLLLQTPAAVRFISLEPQLAHVDLENYLRIYPRDGGPTAWAPRILDWVIVGGESGPGARPFDVAWARSTVAACKAAGVPVFVKQLGSKPTSDHRTARDHGEWIPLKLLRDRKGGDMSEWPEKDLRVREFPR
jgi:protein gp37